MPGRIDLASGSASRRAELIAAAAALAALTLLLFLPALSPDAAFYFRDVSQNHRPYRQLTLAMIEGGHAPLWNPLRGTGQPLMANPNALVLHPTTLLFLVLPFEAAFKASIISMIYLAGLATWLVLRDAGASRSAALIGAALFATSGYMASLGNLINLLGSAAFMPLTLWLIGRAAARGFAPWGSLAAVSLAVQILAGEPAILLCTAAAAAALLWLGACPVAKRAPVAVAARVAGAVGLAVALAMIGLLPGIELLARAERGAGFDRAEALKWSLPPTALVEAAAPGVFGDPTRVGLSRFWGGGLFDSGLPFILSVHLGAGGLILAGLGLRRSGGARTEAILVGALAFAGACMAMGRHLPLYPALLEVLPPLSSVRYPVKFFLLTTWAVAWLAARGFDAAAAAEPSARARVRRAAAPAAMVLAALLMQIPQARDMAVAWLMLPAGQVAEHLPAIRSGIGRSFLWMGAMSALAGIALWAPLAPRARRLLLAAVCLGGALSASWRLNPVAPSSFYEEEPALAGALARAGSQGRVWATPRPRGFAFRTPAAADADSLRWGFRWDRMTMRNATYFPAGPAFAYDRGNERLDVLPGASVGRLLYEGGGAMPSGQIERLLTVAGVDRVISYGRSDLPSFAEAGRLEGESSAPVVVSSHSRPMPRAWLAGEVEIHPDPLRAMARLKEPDFDLYRVAILEEGRSPGAVRPAGGASTGETRILADEPCRVLIETSSPAPAYLVLADTYYPGWEASVDGAAAPIVRANVMFRAVAVPSGRHQVEFVYRPPSVRAGLLITLAALALAALLARPRRA